MKYKTLHDITFPLYTITPDYKRIWSEFNVLYIETRSGTYVLDNKNLDGDTVGKRRLRINGYEKYMPRAVIFSVAQLIHSRHKVFMDSTGTVFKYVRNKTAKLIYYKVSEVKRLEDSCVLILKDIDYPIKMNCRKAHSIYYVGLLNTDMGIILYDLSETKKGNTWRKI